MARDPNAVADKWARNLGASTKSITDGVNGVTVSPTERAAANKQGYVNGVMEAANSGKWEAGLRRVSAEDWKRSMVNVGIPRIGPGAAANKPKMAAFMADMLPFQDTVAQRVRAMPAATFEDRMARANEMMRGMHNYKRNR